MNMVKHEKNILRILYIKSYPAFKPRLQKNRSTRSTTKLTPYNNYKSTDYQDITEKMHDADAICFATPIYYEMCGQTKAE